MHPAPTALLNALVPRLRIVLGGELVALYLYGSLVLGDFDPDISDIDLVALLETPLAGDAFDQIAHLHAELTHAYPEWENRIEVAYIDRDALRTFKTLRSPIAVISPGEPLNIKEAGSDWLINWYMVQKKGVTLYGAPPADTMPPISESEFIQSVCEQACQWREYIKQMTKRPQQAYGILTLCRALYAVTHGIQVSKHQAAEWAITALPQWAHLIRSALLWRETYRNPNVDHAATYPETLRFVEFVIREIESKT